MPDSKDNEFDVKMGWVKDHLSTIESSMMGFFAVAISMLVFPLSLYTENSPHLLFLAFLGYLCSGGFLVSLILCQQQFRVVAFRNRFGQEYRVIREQVAGIRGPIIETTEIVTLASIVLLMAVPWIYVSFLPTPTQPIPVLGTVQVVALSMFGFWIIGLFAGIVIYITLRHGH